MALVVEQIGTIMSAVEPNGSFCTEIAYNSFTADPVVEDRKLVLDFPRETPGLLQHRVDGYPVKVVMPKTAQLEARMNLQALAARASGLAVANRLAVWLKVVMGGQFIGTGTTVNDGSATTTEIDLTSAANFREGGIAVFATGTGGLLEARVIKTVSSNTITLKHALSSQPVNGSDVYAGVTNYMANGIGSEVTSLQAIWQGLGAEDRWLLKGGQCLSGFSLDVAPGSIPRLTFPWTFADFDAADGSLTTMDLFSDALTDPTFSSVGINAVMDSEFRVSWDGDTAAALVHAAEINFAPAITYGPHRTPAGTNTVKQWVRTRSAPVVTGSFVVPYEDYADYIEEFHEGTPIDFAIHMQIGMQPGSSGGGALIDIPHCLIDSVQREDMGGIAGQRINWYAREDSRTTTNSTDLQKSALRIHLF